LDVSKNGSLTVLSCASNPLSFLNVDMNRELIHLYCSDNGLTNLNLSNNSKLNYLNCNFNNFASLDVSMNLNLQSLFCTNNLLSANALDVLFETLHDYVIEKSIYIGYNRGTDYCNKNIAIDKGWFVDTDKIW
jgi:hypothetical protein